MSANNGANLVPLNWTATPVFFEFISEDRTSASAILWIVSWSLVGLVGAPLLAGALSYKLHGSLNYQTLIDKLAAYFISLLLTLSLCGSMIYGFRMLTPLPELVCTAVYVSMRAAGLIVTLLIVEVTVLRYLYTCVWKNVGVLDDDFFGRFFAVMNTLLFITFAVIISMTMEDHGDLYLAACEGEYPSKQEDVGRKTRWISLVHLLLASVCLLFSAATYLADKRVKAKIAPPNIAKSSNHASEVRSMFGFNLMSSAFVTLCMVASLVPGIYTRRMILLDKLSSVPDFVLTAAVVLPVIPSLVMAPAVMYVDDCRLRRHLVRQITNSRLGLWLAGIMRSGVQV